MYDEDLGGNEPPAFRPSCSNVQTSAQDKRTRLRERSQTHSWLLNLPNIARPKKLARGAREGPSARESKEPRMLRLRIVRGSFLTDADGAAGEQRAMASALWSTMPEDLLWRVLHFVPATKRFQWKLVSRKWREVLTSGVFRNALEEQRVVASVVNPLAYRGSGDDDTRLKVVDIDLSSMLPSSDPYFINAAGDGLVCVSNGEYGSPASHCVLNPITRMCKVLPQFPFKPRVWLPLTPNTVTMLGYMTAAGERNGEVHVATYDLAAGGREWDLASYQTGEGWAHPMLNPPVVALCGGETFWYRKSRVHVVVPRPGGRLVEITALDEPFEPSESLMQSVDLEHSRVHLAVHGGNVFFVKALESWHQPEWVMCVWRLARERLQWEPVARLDVAGLKQLTGLAHIRRKSIMCQMWTACAVREVLYFSVQMSMKKRCMLGLNLDTGEWQLVDHVSGPIISWLLELRPDLPPSVVNS